MHLDNKFLLVTNTLKFELDLVRHKEKCCCSKKSRISDIHERLAAKIEESAERVAELRVDTNYIVFNVLSSYQ